METPNLSAGGALRGTSPYPPSYHSGWAEDIEKYAKEPEIDVRPIQFLKTRATTFSSVAGKEVKSKFGKAQKFVTRSGTGLSELPLDATLKEQEGKRRRFSGWRGGVLAAVASAGSVLLVNFVFTIWAANKSQSGLNIGVIWEGECSTIQTADLWIHILVNILGTVLLGSSNYTMQCLSSPTRREVDAAHAVGKYVDIGIPSFRNLRGWRKKTLFGLLVVSTVPLHFLWNSAVFTTSQQLDYQVYVVTPNFFQSPTVDCSQNASIRAYESDEASPSAVWRTPLAYTGLPGQNLTDSADFWQQEDTCSDANALLTNATKGTLQRLSNEECINAYGPADSLISHRGNVLAVTKSQPANTNDTVLLNFRYEILVSNYTGNNWVCDPTYINTVDRKCNWEALAKNANSSWNLGAIDPVTYSDERFWEFPSSERWPIDYCLSQVTELGGQCKLQYSLIIMICVLIANSIKFAVIFYFLRTSVEPVLATIGDGIATFLERPDTTTTERPFLSRKAARHFKTAEESAPVRYQDQAYALRWWHAPSLPRWSITLSLCTLAICVTIYLLTIGAEISHPFSTFGTYNPQAVLHVAGTTNGGSGDISAGSFSSNSILISMVAVANIPQVLVSCLYFAYNTVYTSMVSADEWSRFTTHRKTLRTTDPRGLQRSTYWLSLPWTYALPLAAASSMLHWLISQALFIARTEILNTAGDPEPISYMEVGYSPLAILFALLFGSSMVIGMVINGARKLKGGILVGNNSLAIAAACQRPEKDFDAYMKPVQWGALVQNGEKCGNEGHCTFTSQEVQPPIIGELYI